MKRVYKIGHLCVICCMAILFTGCSKEASSNDAEPSTSNIAEVLITGEMQTLDEGNLKKEIVKTETNVHKKLCETTDSKALELKNIETNEVIHTYVPEKENIYIGGYLFQYDEGYAAVSYTEQMQLEEFILFDQELNVVNTYSFPDILEPDIYENCFSMDISTDGHMLVLSLGFQLYYYNLDDGTSGYLVENTEGDISFDSIQFMGNDKVAFIGSSTDEGENDCCTGYYDLQENKVYKFAIRDYYASNFSVNGNFICICDTINPATEKSSGRVILLDTNSQKMSEVKIKEEGSTMACISQDGTYIYAMNTFAEAEQYYVMQYHTQTGKCLKEYEVSFDGDIKIFSIEEVGKGQVVLIYFNGENIATKLVTCEDNI